MNKIEAFLIIILLLSSVIAMPFLLNSSCDSTCFKKKYETAITLATFIKYEMSGRNNNAVYQFKVKEQFFTTKSSLTKYGEQIGDEFEILYDIHDPNNNYLLFENPIIPAKLIAFEGEIVKIDFFSKSRRVEVLFKYIVNEELIYRIQYFNEEYYSIIKEIYNRKLKVVIEVVPQNARRSFLNIEKSKVSLK